MRSGNFAHEFNMPKKVGPAVPPKPKRHQYYGENIYANEPSYVNIPIYRNVGNISPPTPPPPPPPPMIMSTPLSNISLKQNLSLDLNYSNSQDDFPPPPSPVSSSYSELQRAMQPPDDFDPYSLGSRTSLACESIYEPINPPCNLRTASSLSNYSNTIYSSTSRDCRPQAHNQDAQVDELTTMLVKNLDPSSESEEVLSYDICVKCKQNILDECGGCTAMDKSYHIECFTCAECSVQLQGKPFYALNGKPYCTEDYMNSLEKCSVCNKPIMDRILRATGRPYHPKCFCCTVCGKSLDGVTFTVDAVNEIYCIEDFHRRFAPRCCVCKLPIMPERGREETIRIVALDRSFHISCYKCEDCGLILSTEAEGRGCYPLDDHVLCKSCNIKRIQLLSSQIPISTDL